MLVHVLAVARKPHPTTIVGSREGEKHNKNQSTNTSSSSIAPERLHWLNFLNKYKEKEWNFFVGYKGITF